MKKLIAILAVAAMPSRSPRTTSSSRKSPSAARAVSITSLWTPAARRLYVSHGTNAVVIDIDTDKLVGEVTNTPGIHGIAFAPDLGLGFTSNGRENKASVFDLKTLATKSKIDTGPEPGRHPVLTRPERKFTRSTAAASSATVIDAKTGKVVATIPLSGKPEIRRADPKAGRVYDNIEDKNEIAVIDTKTHTVVATWPIAPGEEAPAWPLTWNITGCFIGCDNKL